MNSSPPKAASWNLLRRAVSHVRRFLFGPPQVPPQIVVNGVHISVDPEATEHFFDFNATGARVWPAAPVLIRHLENSPSLRQRLSGARVLELGSGLGLVGLSIAALGAKKVCLTDRLVPRFADPRGTSGPILHSEFQLKALDSNVEANIPALRHTNCELVVKELAFGNVAAATQIVDEHGPFDVVVGSDVTFFEPAIPALVQTLRCCVSHSESAGGA